MTAENECECEDAGGDCGDGLSSSPTTKGAGEVGGDLALRMLPMLLFGRGGGGSPVKGSSGLRESEDERRLGPGVLERSSELLVCSSYSSAARKFGDISMGLGCGRVKSCISLWTGRETQGPCVSVMVVVVVAGCQLA